MHAGDHNYGSMDMRGGMDAYWIMKSVGSPNMAMYIPVAMLCLFSLI